MYNHVEISMPMQIKDAIAGMTPTARDSNVPQLRGTAYMQSPSPNPDLPPLPHPSDVRQMNSQFSSPTPDPYGDQRRQNILNSNPYRPQQNPIAGYGGYNPYNQYNSRYMEYKALKEVPEYIVGAQLPQGFVPDMRQLPDDFRCSNPAPINVPPPVYVQPDGTAMMLSLAGIGGYNNNGFGYSPFNQQAPMYGNPMYKPNYEDPYRQFVNNQQPAYQRAPQMVNPHLPNPHIEPPAMHMVQANGMKPMDFGYNPYMPPSAQPQHSNVDGARVSGNILQDFQQPTPSPKEMLGNIGNTNYGLPNYAPIGYNSPGMMGQYGGVYNIIEAQMIPGIQDNPYNMYPSQAAIDYYYANLGRGYNIIDPFVAAKENYARTIGFASAAEMDAELEFTERCDAYRRAKMRGLSDEDADAYVYSIFDKPKDDMAEAKLRAEEAHKKYLNTPAPHILVKLYDKDGNLLVSTENYKPQPHTVMHQQAFERELSSIERNWIITKYCKEYINQFLYNIALERNYDHMGAVDYFNDGFYMIHMRNDLITLQAQKSHRFRGAYNTDEFKRKLRENYTLNYSDQIRDLKNRIKFRMDEELPDGVISGGKGYMPGGIKLDEDPTIETMDPNRGYLHRFNTLDGTLSIEMPILDSDEIDRIRFERFKRSIRGGG